MAEDPLRDRFTVTAYLMLGFFLLSRSLLAPFISYRSAGDPDSSALLGFHVTVAAAGIVLVGLLWDRAGRRIPRRRAAAGSAVLLGAGAAGLAAPGVAVTLPAAFLLGAAGSVLNITLHSALSDRHGERRGLVFGEAAVVSGVFGALAPILVSAAAGLPLLGWRWGLTVPALLVVALLPPLFRVTVPPAAPTAVEPPAVPPAGSPTVEPTADGVPAGSPPRLPALFWTWLLLLFLCGATEWAVVYWGASYLHGAVGFPVGTATAALGGLLAVSIVGKIVWSVFSRRIGIPSLVLGCLVVALTGLAGTIAAGWLHGTGRRPLALAALATFALGISGTAQLGTAGALGVRPEFSTRAMSRVSLSAGLSVILFPLLLGAAAQSAGITRAFLVPCATGVAALVVAVGLRKRASDGPPGRTPVDRPDAATSPVGPSLRATPEAGRTSRS